MVLLLAATEVGRGVNVVSLITNYDYAFMVFIHLSRHQYFFEFLKNIVNDLTVIYNNRKFLQIFNLFSDLHQARMRGRGRGKRRERGEDEEGKEARLEK